MELSIRPYRPGEENYVADLHRRLYSEEYSWGPKFTDYAEKIALDFAKKEPSPREELLIAEGGDGPIGCIMLCQTDDRDVGQLRLFAVEKDCRRLGAGTALLEAFMEKARAAGYKKLILWTAAPLTAAIRRYEKLGFKTTESAENHEWSTKGEVVEELKMEMEMPAGGQ